MPKINLSSSSFLDNNNNNESKRKSFSFFKNSIKKQNSFEKKVIKKYCALSEAGKDSYGMTKINQDSYLVLTNINGLINFNVFAVFDGHGPQGHLVSQFLVKYFTDFFNNNKDIKKCKNESEVFNLFLHSNYKLLKNNWNKIIDRLEPEMILLYGKDLRNELSNADRVIYKPMISKKVEVEK